MNYYTTDELYHHGILGMKWGIRRYQNPDGTLTEEGKKRYAGLAGTHRKKQDKSFEFTKKAAATAIASIGIGLAASTAYVATFSPLAYAVLLGSSAVNVGARFCTLFGIANTSIHALNARRVTPENEASYRAAVEYIKARDSKNK